MKVVLDARKLGDGGIGVYIENLVEGFLETSVELGTGVELSLLVDPTIMAGNVVGGERDRIADQVARWKNSIKFVEEAAGKYSFSEYFGLARRQRALLEEADLFHSPHYTLPYSLPIPAVVTIHDVIHVSKPETVYHRPVARSLIRSAVHRAAHVITVSNISLARLTKVVGCCETPLSVIPNALRREIQPLPRSTVDPILAKLARVKPYCLYVGSDREHKNFSNLVRAWYEISSVLRRNSFEQPQLVVVGDRFSEKSHALVRELGLTDVVKFIGTVSVQDLAALYNGSHAVIVPSLEEGFGLVALEAMACGVPVVCSPEGSLKEVCENCAWYAEDCSAEALAESVVAVLTNPELAEDKVREGLSRSRLFKRDLVAAMTLSVYEQVVAQNISDGGQNLFSGKNPDDLEISDRRVFADHLRRAM